MPVRPSANMRGRGGIRGSGTRVMKRPASWRAKPTNAHASHIATAASDLLKQVKSPPNKTQKPTTLPGLEKCQSIVRKSPRLSACSELSPAFIDSAGLETDEDTNTITLNLMDRFLFSKDNWDPALSYTRLHAACFFMASFVTGKQNTIAQIAKAFAPDSAFVRIMASPYDVDEASAVVIRNQISITLTDVEKAYGVLYEQGETLASLMGEYGANISQLPHPGSLEDEFPQDESPKAEGEKIEEVDFDKY